MSYINNGGIYKNEDRYAIIFLRAYEELTPMEQKVVMETKVNGDVRTYPEYLKIVAKIANIVAKEDEELAELVYMKMCPTITLSEEEDIKRFDGEMKNKAK